MSFLYRIHRDALTQTPGARVYYEDHADFNEAFDRNNDVIRLGDLEFLPSRVLFQGDHEAYRAAVLDYITERDGDDSGTPAAAQDDAKEEAP